MNRKKVFLVIVGIVVSITMNAQKVYTYVQQNGTVVEADGTAAFDLSDTPYTVEFDSNGNAVMTIGGNTVAKIPTSDGGQLCVDFTNNSGLTAGTLPVTVKEAGYGTLYSPFQLSVPTESDVEIYAPTYDETNHVLKCNSDTKVAGGAVIPIGTALLLKNAGTINFGFSADASTDTHVSVLSGSALAIAKPSVESGNALYTLGHEVNDNTKFGFFEFNGTSLSAGKAYLVAARLNSQAKYVDFNFDDAIVVSNIDAETPTSSAQVHGKYIENGRVVIINNGQKYSTSGQRLH